MVIEGRQSAKWDRMNYYFVYGTGGSQLGLVVGVQVFSRAKK